LKFFLESVEPFKVVKTPAKFAYSSQGHSKPGCSVTSEVQQQLPRLLYGYGLMRLVSRFMVGILGILSTPD
jgi:hypothetical protein